VAGLAVRPAGMAGVVFSEVPVFAPVADRVLADEGAVGNALGVGAGELVHTLDAGWIAGYRC